MYFNIFYIFCQECFFGTVIYGLQKQSAFLKVTPAEKAKQVKNKDLNGKTPGFYCSFYFFYSQEAKKADRPKETDQSAILIFVLLF